MRQKTRLVVVFLAMELFAPGEIGAQDVAGQPKGSSPRPKITQEEVDDLKLSRYEVERSEIKYQPYIITHDDQELVQLVYDTRREAQSRVDEINTEDRLDKLGVEGRQNKKVGIREVKRTHTEIILNDDLEKFAKKLAVKEKARYLTVRKDDPL
jgi:hypothetical protein